jgi:medium-chain acyl-[acyl-carrier-protein] hydrolase
VEVCAVQLPARQDRIHDAPLTRISTIVDKLEAALRELPPAPLSFYGHSFGAVVGLELARHLRGTDAEPRALVVGARRAPTVPGVHDDLYKASPSDFAAILHRLYGTPWAVLRDPEVMGLLLPSLRADFEALATHEYNLTQPLDVALTVLHGRKDASLTLAEVKPWSHVAARGCVIHEVDAGHFFVDTHRTWVFERVTEALAQSHP